MRHLLPIAGLILLPCLALAADDAAQPQRHLLLKPTPNNPRNSEGAFVTLKDGRILFIYTHFTGGAADHAAAHLASRVSKDNGRTWTDADRLVVEREGKMNVMSVSLLRLRDGRIALLYLVKNSADDCRPHLRFSADEGETWSPAKPLLPEPGYYVVNNDRLVQLANGRLIVPAAQHDWRNDKPGFHRGVALCFYSDDAGATWTRSDSALDAPPQSRSGLQEPLVVELKQPGRLLMLCRTDLGSQYRSDSQDAGRTWTPARPTDLASPLSPATVKRIPGRGDLLILWNDHRNADPALRGKRTPLSAALSRDDGQTWSPGKTIEADPQGWYCYTALEFTPDGRALIAYCSERARLAATQITSFPIEWLDR